MPASSNYTAKDRPLRRPPEDREIEKAVLTHGTFSVRWPGAGLTATIAALERTWPIAVQMSLFTRSGHLLRYRNLLAIEELPR